MSSDLRSEKENLRIQAQLDSRAAKKNFLGRIIPYLGLIFLIIFFTVVTGGTFLNKNNLYNMIEQCFTMVIVAVGASFVYAQGNLDFSIGSACGVAQMCGAILMLHHNVPFVLAMLVTLIIPIITCCIVSTIASVFRVPVFIGSMCVRSLLQGLLTIGVSRQELVIPVSKYPFMNNNMVKAIVLLAVVALGIYLFHYTRIGKWARAIGGNVNTARQVGIKVTRQIFLAYALLGVCVGIAACFQMFRNASVSMSSGTGMEFNIMLAIVLGGFPMSGGEKSTVLSAVVGAVTAMLLTNGLSVWGLDPGLVGGVKGAVFVAIIALSYDRSAGKLVS